MTEDSIVYWASPFEMAAIKNSAQNMITNNLVKTPTYPDLNDLF